MADIYSRRSFIGRLGLSGCALPLTAFTQQRARPLGSRRIGFLSGAVPTLFAAFERELQRLGYVDGNNIIIERRISRPNTSDLNDHAAELAKMDLDLVLAGALPQALAMRKSNPNMPMVIATCPGMVSNGFAKSMKRPGGIYTGMDELPPGVTAKRIELLKTAAPKIKRVALLSTTPGTGGHEAQLADAEQAAKRLKIAVKAYRAASLTQLETALAAIINDGMDGMTNFQGGLSVAYRDLIVSFAAKHRLPAVYQSRFFVESGGLMAWAPDQEKQYSQAANYVVKILNGSKPGDLAVHFPDRYYLSINKSAAERIGLTLPMSLIRKADLLQPQERKQ